MIVVEIVQLYLLRVRMNPVETVKKLSMQQRTMERCVFETDIVGG